MWPTRRAIFSTGTPASDSSETKLCRSSRGVQSVGLRPAAAVTLRNARRTFAASRATHGPDAAMPEGHPRSTADHRTLVTGRYV